MVLHVANCSPWFSIWQTILTRVHAHRGVATGWRRRRLRVAGRIDDPRRRHPNLRESCLNPGTGLGFLDGGRPGRPRPAPHDVHGGDRERDPGEYAIRRLAEGEIAEPD